MKGAAALLALALASVHPHAAGAGACPSPDDYVLHDVVLDHARAAVARRHGLTILAIGGSTTSGAAGGGDAFSYTTRLADRLQDALPGVALRIETRAALRRSARAMVERLDRDLADTSPDLMIWGVGGVEAARHVDLDSFAATLERGIAKAHDAGADVILMDVQYAPSIASMLDLTSYRDATAAAAASEGAAFLDRHDLMRRWSETGAVDLDATAAETRMLTARHVFDCFAAILADGIAAAVRRK